LQATFAARNTHPLPPHLPAPPASWRRAFLRTAGQTGLQYTSLEEATRAMQSFLDPVLSGQVSGAWNPVLWRWE